MSDNVTRVLLPDEVNTFIAEDATEGEAYMILNLAADAQEQGREMTLQEALQAIGRIAAYVEAIG